MRKILFICTGNICRSPMAEGFLNNYLRDYKLNYDYVAHSAGTFAADDDEASNHSIKAMEEKDIDISNHRARMVTEEMIAESEVVLGMTNSHKAILVKRFPQFEAKIFTLHEFAQNDILKDVEDPYGYDIDVYRNCAKEIQDVMIFLVEKLKNDRYNS